jgi:DNA-binding NtrC family response regulator
MLQLYGQERIGEHGVRDVTVGLLERAPGGTLIIDGIELLDTGGQQCLRQLLLDPIYCRRGSAELRQADMRIIAMTSHPLLELVQRGQFCETLFHLLTATWLDLPPLRQRREDIALLAAAFLSQSPALSRQLPPATLLRLLGHGWPGNVHELHSVLGRAAEHAQGGVIQPAHLDQLLGHAGSRREASFRAGTKLAAVQREMILLTLAAVGGNKKDAAALLGLSRGALYSHLRTYKTQAEAEWRAAQQHLSSMARADAPPF